MFPACTADHNCCGVAETFFGCCTSEEECAFEAARAGATAAWLAPSGCSAFAGCGVADGDDVRVIRSVEDAPAVCGLCLCGDPVGAAFLPLDAVEVSLSQARICSRAGALNSKKRRPPVRFAESIHANWTVASIALFRSTDRRSCSKSFSLMGVRLSKHNPSSERFRTEPLSSPPSLQTIRSGCFRSCNRRFAFIVV